MNDPKPWWQNAVCYQVYVRSFADGDGDGVGDLPGITSRLPYLRDLGVDALWITPFYPSPQNDHGYDVSDYRDVDPLFGSLDDADTLIATAHDLGLRVIVDIVPNHTSDEHAWFQEALAAPIAVLLWLYLVAIAVLIGAAVNAAFDEVFPQNTTTRARLELVQRLRERLPGR